MRQVINIHVESQPFPPSPTPSLCQPNSGLKPAMCTNQSVSCPFASPSLPLPYQPSLPAAESPLAMGEADAFLFPPPPLPPSCSFPGDAGPSRHHSLALRRKTAAGSHMNGGADGLLSSPHPSQRKIRFRDRWYQQRSAQSCWCQNPGTARGETVKQTGH